jgi:orotate phosphoribosyltransferase
MTTPTISTAGRSLLGVVTETANAVSNIASTAGGAVSMLNRYVTDAQKKQNITSVVSMDDFRHFALREKSIDNAKRELVITKELQAEPLLESLYNEHLERLEKLFETPAN